tara:strand:+ start:1494 stop:1784 length:291 start_codon:yes stop_codon:yes gene_type:complete
MSLVPTEIIYEAIDDLNARGDRETTIEKSPETLLFGLGGLDSLDLVNLIVAIEEKIENQTGKVIVLVNEETLEMKDTPFKTVATLSAFLQNTLNTV